MRIRTIKPEFWQSETIAETQYFSRLMAIAILNYADDEGYFYAVPQVIRGAIFPFEEDSKNVLGAFQELSRVGFLAFGTDENGKRVGKIVNFLEHQRIDKPQPSKIAGLAVAWDKFQESSGNIPGVFPVGKGNGMEEEWNGRGMEKDPATTGADVPAPRPQKRQAPTEEEWVAYCTETWPDWSSETSADAWAYYTSVRWRTKAGPIVDWKSAARTAHGNAKKWGTLQPREDPPTRDEYFSFAAEMAMRTIPFPDEPRYQWPEERWRESFNRHDAKGWAGIKDWRSALKADCQQWVSREIETRKRPSR